MNFVGFNIGQFGDVVMNVVPCRALKAAHPGCHITLGIAQKYEAIKDLFLHNPLIDDIHIWEGYDHWPTEKDKRYMETRANTHSFFYAMPKHTRDDWWNYRHQVEEACLMHGLVPPQDLRITLTKYWKPKPLYRSIAIAPFGAYGAGHKSLPVEKAERIVAFCRQQGFAVIQLGDESEPKLDGAVKVNQPLATAVQFMTETCLLITVDTAMAWIASGYEHPTLGLYSDGYYGGARVCAIQPINKNATYLSATHCSQIPNELIFEHIKQTNEKIRH